MLPDQSQLVESAPDDVLKIFYLAASSIFGVRSDNLSDELFQLALLALPNRFQGITVTDVRNAFFDTEIIKKEFVSLTRDELLQPISIYWIKKQNLLQQIKLIEMENEKEQNEKQKEIEFYNQARELYKESLKGGKWLGDMFQARAIARPFWDALYLDERNGLKMIAADEVTELKIKAIDNPLILVYDPKFYLAHEVIKFAVRQNKKFIQL